jgi:hypothetical protein
LKILAVMQRLEFRDQVRLHHKDSYKNWKRIERQILADRSTSVVEDIGEPLKEKFSHLINENKILLRA